MVEGMEETLGWEEELGVRGGGGGGGRGGGWMAEALRDIYWHCH